MSQQISLAACCGFDNRPEICLLIFLPAVEESRVVPPRLARPRCFTAIDGGVVSTFPHVATARPPPGLIPPPPSFLACPVGRFWSAIFFFCFRFARFRGPACLFSLFPGPAACLPFSLPAAAGARPATCCDAFVPPAFSSCLFLSPSSTLSFSFLHFPPRFSAVGRFCFCRIIAAQLWPRKARGAARAIPNSQRGPPQPTFPLPIFGPVYCSWAPYSCCEKPQSSRWASSSSESRPATKSPQRPPKLEITS